MLPAAFNRRLFGADTSVVPWVQERVQTLLSWLDHSKLFPRSATPVQTRSVIILSRPAAIHDGARNTNLSEHGRRASTEVGAPQVRKAVRGKGLNDRGARHQVTIVLGPGEMSRTATDLQRHEKSQLTVYSSWLFTDVHVMVVVYVR